MKNMYNKDFFNLESIIESIRDTKSVIIMKLLLWRYNLKHNFFFFINCKSQNRECLNLISNTHVWLILVYTRLLLIGRTGLAWSTTHTPTPVVITNDYMYTRVINAICVLSLIINRLNSMILIAYLSGKWLFSYL